MLYTWVYVLVSVLGLLGFAGLIYGYIRQGTVKAAMDTVTLLKIKADELETEVNRLRVTVTVLQDLVTQVAPVKDLAEKSELRHEENILFLTRLEGSLSRLESHVIRGER